ncbi:S1C family serine protease [Desertibacillus haloalkaliphilus]|uniref:S1C family serine protease n=1 Tax=Desertibacillus haloalkaliphilus TaxID=1328930 RepID=UPI001C270465|nr:S1C family serine protease [Desertibacillus haloalkaliphilus]MBU8905788.1 S1C family serine protease [Desertibacillus haloalkaliphilus]
MGYYDEHYSNERRSEQRNRKGIGLSAFVGAVVGGLVVLLAQPLLSPDQGGSEVADPTTVPIETEQLVGVDESVNVSVNSDITEAVEMVSDAVVGVINLQQSNFWSEAGGEGTGSGVIYKVDGDRAFVVTNHHVIEGASQVEVSLSDGSRVEAEVLGADIFTDLAVLEIESENVTTSAEFGNSELLRVGEPAIAIGNPLGLEFSRSVTQGIISATERSIPVDLSGNRQVDWHAEVIQTDAAINPGNSGGALINIQGQVIGINSMKIARSSVEGIGFAIPSSLAIPIINDLERFGEVQRPQMGVGIRSLSEIPSYHWQQTLNLPDDVKAGVFIMSVSPMSPADHAGLDEYDVIVGLDDNEIKDSHDLRKYLYTEKSTGDQMEVSFYRDGQKQTVTLELTEETY